MRTASSRRWSTTSSEPVSSSGGGPAVTCELSGEGERYVGEMREIADAGCRRADAGAVPRRWPRIYADLAERVLADAPEDVPDDIVLDDVLRRLSVRHHPDDAEAR